jgi:hypothetical protein
MRFQLLIAIAASLTLLPAHAARITDQQAQNLPVAELAHLALGAAGDLMMEVERPDDGSLKWGALQFHSRAVVTGSQFGMCGSDWVSLHFDDEGLLESIDAQRRYGVEGDIYREPGNWTYNESGAICDSVKTTRGYFPAPGSQEALEIALYVDAISGRGQFSKQNFSFTCDGVCSQSRNILASLKLEDIDEARIIDCAPTNLKIPSCFELVIGEGRVGPFPKKFRIYGTNYMNKVIITTVKVYVGSTLA